MLKAFVAIKALSCTETVLSGPEVLPRGLASTLPGKFADVLLETETGPSAESRRMSLKSSAGKSARPTTRRVSRSSILSSVKQKHLVSEEPSSSESGADASSTSDSSNDAYTWSAGAWGACRANCGTGSSFRSVQCVETTGSVVDDSLCEADGKPPTRQSCQGDCLQCNVNNDFLKAISGGQGTSQPILSPDNKSDLMCQVTSPYTCCESGTDAQLQVMYFQMTRGLVSQTQHRDANKDLIQQVYENITEVFNNRVADSDDAVQRIYDAMDAETAAPTGDALTLKTLRESLSKVLSDRSDTLQTALSDLATAQFEFSAQMDSMDSLPGDDDVEESASDASDTGSSLFEGLGDWFSSSQADPYDDSSLSQEISASMFLQRRTVSKIHFDSGETSQKALPPSSYVQTVSSSASPGLINFTDPTLRIVSKSCDAAVKNHFSSLACAGCNPRFPIAAREAPETPLVSLPTSSCAQLYSGCSASLGTAHTHLVDGLGALLNSHGNMITLAAQVQPILEKVWSELHFDWLPGFSASQVAVPDLTKMSCVQDLHIFKPFEISNSTDFCVAYFSYASPKPFVKRISNQLDRGLFAFGKFASCDKCLHETLMFLTDVLDQPAKGSLAVSIPTRAQAMLSSCGAMPVQTVENPTSDGVSSRKAEILAKYSKMAANEKVSPRVRFAFPGAELELRGLATYTNVSATILESATGMPPHEWNQRTLMKSSLNKTARNIPVSSDSLSFAGPDAALKVYVMNINCTKHSECHNQDSPSGMRPWWFCAHPNICLEQPGSCSPEGAALFESGPKCVRGPCTSGSSSIDTVCPDNAICPAQTGSLAANPTPFFGKEYFAKFDLKIRVDDPLSAAPPKGVCDCAFDQTGVVMDKCQYARCLAYASLVEKSLTCTTGLASQCVSIRNSDPDCADDATLSCSDPQVILTYPPEIAGECKVNPSALASETSFGSESSPTSWVLLVSLFMVGFW